MLADAPRLYQSLPGTHPLRAECRLWSRQIVNRNDGSWPGTASRHLTQSTLLFWNQAVHDLFGHAVLDQLRLVRHAKIVVINTRKHLFEEGIGTDTAISEGPLPQYPPKERRSDASNNCAQAIQSDFPVTADLQNVDFRNCSIVMFRNRAAVSPTFDRTLQARRKSIVYAGDRGDPAIFRDCSIVIFENCAPVAR